MLIHILALALAIQKEPDAWTLKPPVEKAARLVWGMTIEAQQDGMEHHATFDLVRRIKSTDATKTIATYTWEKLAVDDHDGQEVPEWNVELGKHGEIVKTEDSLDDNYRRMLSTLIFVYPDKPISIGDKWSQEIKPTGTGAKIRYAYEAKKTENVNGTNTIILSATVTEDGKDSMSGEGTWWLSRVGRVIKFEIKVKNWIVPMAGSDGTIEGVIRGQVPPGQS